MSNEESAARRTPRQGAGGSPVGSTISIVLAVVAVIAGFLILQNITDDGATASSPSAGDPSGGAGGDDVPDPDDPIPDLTTTTTTTTTTLPRVTEGAIVMVANANTISGSAGAMTRTLELAGYTMTDPTNATGPNLEDSIVQYDESVATSRDVAESVARDLGGVEVETVPSPAPTESGSLGEASVLVLLGDNQAGKTLEELAGAAADTTPATGTTPADDATTDTTADTTADTTGDTTADTTGDTTADTTGDTTDG